jgi:hypothetical protein
MKMHGPLKVCAIAPKRPDHATAHTREHYSLPLLSRKKDSFPKANVLEKPTEYE